MDRRPSRWIVMSLGALAAAAALLAVGAAVVTGNRGSAPSPMTAAFHVLLTAGVPAWGVGLVARAGDEPRERAGLLVLVTGGALALVTLVFFLARGIGWGHLVTLDGLPVVLAVVAATAALARLRGRPWLAGGVVRHPARLIAAAGAATLGAAEWLPNAGTAAAFWPSALALSVAALATGFVILCAAQFRDAAAVAAVVAVHATVGSVTTLAAWLAPRVDVTPSTPGLRTAAGVLATVLLATGAGWLARRAVHERLPRRRGRTVRGPSRRR